MFARSARFDTAVRASQRTVTAAAVSLGDGDPVTLGVVSGSVDVTGAPGVRRTLTLEVDNTGVEWAALQPDGAVIYLVRGITYADGTQEHVPLGSFRVDDAALSYTGAQTIVVTAPDRWAIIQDSQFEVSTKPTQATYVAEILLLLAPALDGRAAPRVTATHDAPLPAKGIVYTASREDAIYALAEAIGADVAFAADGIAEIRDLPTVKTPPVWTVNAGPDGVLMDATRDRTRVDTYNVVVVQPSSTTGKPPFAQVVAVDDDPTSPTYIGGSFGRKPRFVSSDLILNGVEAAHVAACQLAQSTGLHSQVSLTAIAHPALDVLDSITVAFPARAGLPAEAERHLIDALTYPLDGSGQTISTRAIGAAETTVGP